MKLMIYYIFLISCFVPIWLYGQPKSKILEVGDKAPPLVVQKWIKGEPVLEFKKGHVYVVEFGFVACVPCRAITPHLTELSHKYAGEVTFIGMHVWENNKENLNDLSYVQKVKDYLVMMGDKIDFPTAVDVPQQTTADLWMKAAGKRGAPISFVIDQSGTIAWIGHPGQLDSVLEQVIVGTFDAKAYTLVKEEKKQLEMKYRLKLGDPAPALSVSKWIKGKPVIALKEGEVYLIVITPEMMELNARKNIPLLTKIARKFRDQVTVIGVYSEGTSQEQEVVDFVEELGDQIDYPVAIDDPDRTMYQSWNRAAKKGGITGYIVDREGQIVWFGYPQHMGEVLKETIRGNGLGAGKKRNEIFRRRQDVLKEISGMFVEGNHETALYRLDSLIERNPEDQILYNYKYNYLLQTRTKEGEEKANDLLEWMLNYMSNSYFYWEWFLSDAIRSHPNPNFDLAIAVADRAIKEAETGLIMTDLIRAKAAIYADSVKGMGDLEKAVNVLKEGEKNPKIAKDAKAVSLLRGDFYQYKFRVLAGKNDKEANGLLQKVLNDELDGLKWVWGTLIWYALELQKTPDYNLLLQLADRNIEVFTSATKQEPNYSINNVKAIAIKADIYAAKGDRKKALECYERAVVYSKTTDDAMTIDYYEELLSNFINKEK
ncbi:hypothetical protein LS482_16720 [Sinomicrobium kalidii]|uniref:hypothetical protein n=1 Tax=Sinomicrobium kalidii TaxID=2900738 RepID=UPI001E494967|nr:hypothetical protein [Sinomicrobium kalidii]UGU15316.1 hypothetical protein LS482_16720 [Sinomicrobium kalidii]